MKQRIYRNYFWVALTTILIVSFVFVFSYNRTIHDQKEEGMREEAEFISALLEKQGDADIGFQAAAGKTDFRITLIAENVWCCMTIKSKMYRVWKIMQNGRKS